jgi:hypothetical protein
MSHDPTNQEGFVKWANTQGLVLTAAQGVDVLFRTYEDWHTEFAWRGWANRPHRETRVEFSTHWPTPKDWTVTKDAADIPMRRNAMSPAFAAPYGNKVTNFVAQCDGGNEAVIRSMAARTSAEMPSDLTARVDQIDEAGYVHWKTELSPEDGAIRAYEPLPDDAYHGMPKFPHLPKIADTAHVGAVPCEDFAKRGIQPVAWRYPTMPGYPHWELRYWVDRKSEGYREGEEDLYAAGPLIAATRALAEKLPKDPVTMQCYFARDELVEVRKLLGEM